MTEVEEEVLGGVSELGDVEDIDEEEILASAALGVEPEGPGGAEGNGEPEVPVGLGEEESREALDYEEEPKASDDDDDQDDAPLRPSRAKFSSERQSSQSQPRAPANRSNNPNSKVLLNPNYKGSVRAQPHIGLRVRPGVVHLGVVKLGSTNPHARPNAVHIHIPQRPTIPFHQGPPGNFQRPPGPGPRPLAPAKPLIPSNPRGWLKKPGEEDKAPAAGGDDWHRLTEEFLKKGKAKAPRRSPSPRSGPPRRRRSTSPRGRRSRSRSPLARRQDLETSKKTAKELGLGDEYLRKLAEQRRLADEYRRTKEAKRAAELRQKQRESGARKDPPGQPADDARNGAAERGGGRDDRKRPRTRTPPARRRSRSPRRHRSPASRKRTNDPSRSPSPLKAKAAQDGHVSATKSPSNRTIRLPIHQRPEFTKRGEEEGRDGKRDEGRRDDGRRRRSNEPQSPPRRRPRRSSRSRSRTPRRSRSRSPRRRRRHRRRRSASSSSRSSSSSSSSGGPTPPPYAHLGAQAHLPPGHLLPGQLHPGQVPPGMAMPQQQPYGAPMGQAAPGPYPGQMGPGQPQPLNPAAPNFVPRSLPMPQPGFPPQHQPVIQMAGGVRPGAAFQGGLRPPQPGLPPQPHLLPRQPLQPPLHQQHLPPRPLHQLPPQHFLPQPGPPQPQGLMRATAVRPLSVRERLGVAGQPMGQPLGPPLGQPMPMGPGMGPGMGQGMGPGPVVGPDGVPRPTPGAMIAVVKGLAGATSAERLRLIASTVAPVSLVLALAPGLALLQFANPADAGRFAQSYQGRKLDGAVLNVSIETAR